MRGSCLLHSSLTSRDIVFSGVFEHLCRYLRLNIAMEQFGFDKFNEDDQLELFKYMPIKEGVRFERSNKYWTHLLGRLRLSQKQLSFGWHLARPSKCHPVGLIDQCSDEQIAFEVVIKVISQCKNLKALSFTNDVLEELYIATRLANVLNYNCKVLVHLQIHSKLNSKADGLLDTVLEFGMKLRKLDVCFGELGVFDVYKFWTSLTKLTKLRSLVEDDYFHVASLATPVKLNVNGLALLLETCTKLKYFKLCYHTNGKNITKDEKEQNSKLGVCLVNSTIVCVQIFVWF